MGCKWGKLRPFLAYRKLMLVKINSHVCAERSDRGQRFGRMVRYDSE